MQYNGSESNPAHIYVVIRRRAPLVILCVLLAVGAALAYTLNTQKKYTATASLLFDNTPVTQQIAGLQPVANSNTQAQQDTNTQLLKLGDLAAKTAQTVGHSVTSGEVAASLGIVAAGDTTVVTVSSTLPSPRLAAKVANTYANTFVNEQENGDRQYYKSALATVERQIASLSPAQARGPQGLALQNRAQSLATLAQLRTGTVSLAQSASVPTVPSSPSVKKDVIVAAILGLALGLGVSAGLERLDRRIREPEELEATYELPLLGAVPTSRALRRDRRMIGTKGPDERVVTDTFQFVRARLRYFDLDRELKVLAVVSAQPGDGKTTVAHWLANVSATMGSTTLLIEADLRRPSMSEELGVSHGPGLADVLIGAREFDAAIQAVQTTQPSSGSGQSNLDVMVAGALPPNPAEMLESHAMSKLLDFAKSKYDFIVIDTPPLGVVSDALPLMRSVDGVAVVAGMGHTRRDSAQRLKATLNSVDAPVLGVIANNVSPRDAANYGYSYDYTAKGPSSEGLPPAPSSNGGAPHSESVAPSNESPDTALMGPSTFVAGAQVSEAHLSQPPVDRFPAADPTSQSPSPVPSGQQSAGGPASTVPLAGVTPRPNPVLPDRVPSAEFRTGTEVRSRTVADDRGESKSWATTGSEAGRSASRSVTRFLESRRRERRT